MNIGIIGSGGREHALSFKLKQSKIVDKIYCIPGNAGTKLIAENISIQINDFEKIKKIVRAKKLRLLARFGKLRKALRSYSEQDFSRSTENPDLRFFKIK